MTVYPRGIYRPVPRAATASTITPTVVVVHSNAGSGGDLYSWWTNPAAGGLYSHFQIGLDGTVWQYAPIDRRAPANVQANNYGVSIETANNHGHGTFPGFNTDRWNGAQRAALIDLIGWICDTAGIKRQWCTDGVHGIGPHDQFPQWTTRGHVCPGTARTAQLRTDIIPALTVPPEEPDMTPAQAKQLANATRDAAHGADQAAKAALYAAGANRKAQIALSWIARDGFTAGIVAIYKSRLGRDPEPGAPAAWRDAAQTHTWDEVDRFIGGSPEGKQHAGR